MKQALNIGCGVKPLKRKGYKIINSDKYKNEFTNSTFNAEKRFPFKSNTFDLVIIDGVLEHLSDFYFSVNEIHRILKKEGVLECCVPHFASSQRHWESDHKRAGHSRMFHSYTESEGDKSMRESSQFRKFELIEVRYCINFGTILKPIIDKVIGFKQYEYFFARVLPFNIDIIFFVLKKRGFWK